MTNIVSFNQIESPAIPDVGWLIQNEQVSDEALGSALLEGTCAEIESLAFTLLKSPPDLLTVVNQTIAVAILDRSRFNGQVSGRTWILKLALSECLRTAAKAGPRQADVYTQAARLFSSPAQIDPHSAGIFSGLGQKESFLSVLHYGLGLSAEEISFLLVRGVDQIRIDINGLDIRLREHQETCQECIATARSRPSELGVSLYSHLQTGCPDFNFTEENLSNWKVSILSRVGRLKNERLARSKRAQAAQIGGIVVVLFLLVGLVNTFWSRKLASSVNLSIVGGTSTPGSLLSLAALPTRAMRVGEAPSRATPTIPVASMPDITAIANLAESSLSKWHSLWADVQVINYSPYDLASEPQIIRKELWVNQTSLSARLISGPASGIPDLTDTVSNNHLFIQDFSSGQTSDSLSSDLIQDADLQKLLLPYKVFIPEGVLKYDGTDVIANRPVWILERDQGDYILQRLGIDKEYGVLLYLSLYGGKDMKTKLSDTIVSSIFFNPQISPSIFNPGQYLGDHFANDLSGDPQIVDVQKALAAWTAPKLAPIPFRATPSPAFNPAGSQLSLLDQKTLTGLAAPKNGLDLFADGVYLGVLPLGGSAMLSCERSPDGSKIAYNSVGDSASGDTALRLADLSSLDTIHLVMPDGFTTGDYAFSPDSRSLAFYGCDKPGGFCGVFILDLTTGKLTRLVPLLYADYMFWSPDGRDLALVGAQDGQALMAQRTGQNMLLSEVMALSQPWYFFVLQAASGNLIFKQQFEWSTFKAPVDSPTNSWSTAFKVQPGGFAGCASPPTK